MKAFMMNADIHVTEHPVGPTPIDFTMARIYIIFPVLAFF